MSSWRVCIIGAGDNVHVQRWVHGLAARGLQVSVISTTPAAALGQAVPLLSIPTARAGMTPAARLVTLLRGWARVPALVRALRPDLVHLHALPLPAATLFLRRIPRLIVSTWGSDVVQRDARKARLYPALLAHASAITATSHYLAQVTATYLRRPRPIEVVPFGVDLHRFTPALQAPATLRIGTLRHLEPNYGIDVLLDALPAVLRALPLERCVIAGDGSQRASLQARALARGVDAAIVWPGRVPHAAVPALLRELSLFVNPSRAEAFGVAALEAQACGLPVVATRVGGLPEVVCDGVTGVLVPPEDPQALALALIELLRDPARRATLGRAARAWVAERYDWQHSLDQMVAVYARVVHSRGRLPS